MVSLKRKFADTKAPGSVEDTVNTTQRPAKEPKLDLEFQSDDDDSDWAEFLKDDRNTLDDIFKPNEFDDLVQPLSLDHTSMDTLLDGLESLDDFVFDVGGDDRVDDMAKDLWDEEPIQETASVVKNLATPSSMVTLPITKPVVVPPTAKVVPTTAKVVPPTAHAFGRTVVSATKSLRTQESLMGKPRLVVTLNPVPKFYKDEGGANNVLLINVELHGDVINRPDLFAQASTATNLSSNSIPIECRLLLEDGEPVPEEDQKYLRYMKPPTLKLSTLRGEFVGRIEKVSKNYGGRKMRIEFKVKDCPGIAPVYCEPVQVFSKRKKLKSVVRNKLNEEAFAKHLRGETTKLLTRM